MDSTLIQLGNGIYIYKPAIINPVDDSAQRNTSDSDNTDSAKHQTNTLKATDSDETLSPNIILLFTWMGARLPHIHKYVQAYKKLYPTATQIIVRNEASFFWSSDKANKAYLGPVVQALELLGCLPFTNSGKLSSTLQSAEITRIIGLSTPRVLVHAFSNGGSWQLTTLSDILSKSYSIPNVLPEPSVIVLDSCPGNGGVSKTVAAFSSAIRSPALRFFAALFIRGVFLSFAVQERLASILYTCRMLFRRVLLPQTAKVSPPKAPQTVIDIMKDTLSSQTLLPWFTASTPRLYMYSPLDSMIPDTEVEAHASDAEKRGLRVRREKFDKSGHVAHARMYPERYWGAVAELWEAASADCKANACVSLSNLVSDV